MFALIVVTRDELDIATKFYRTKEDARKAMISDVIALTGLDTLDDIIKECDSRNGEYSEDDIVIETKWSGTGRFIIVEVPNI